LSVEKEIESSNGSSVIVHHSIVSSLKREEFVSDRVSYIVLRVRWFSIIIQNVRAPSEEKSDYYKYSFA
jgi:hypothetical protein